MINCDEKTGIHYGVIHQNHVIQAWADSSEPRGINEDDHVFILDDGEYQAVSDERGDIFVTKSPYYTLCRLCSPCAPNAGYIMSPDELGVMTYCFGHDWFDSGVAPYPVYVVPRTK